MTTKILSVNSSLSGSLGVSTRLIESLLAQLKRNYGDTEIRIRDLNADPVPHLDAATMAAMRTPPEQRSKAQEETLRLASALTQELVDADVLVLAAPMYNFTIPSTVKAWFDHVAWAGVTFRYTAAGPEGLLRGKRAYIVATRGGIYRDTESDTQIPWLKQILNFMGITDIEVIYAEGMATRQAEQGLQAAHKQIDATAEDTFYATAQTR